LPPRFALSLGARVRVERFEADFAVTSDGLHLYARHLARIDSFEPDFVAVAERFVETPYLWGGRTSEGIDCSGLMQSALGAAGVKAPRDSDMMEATLGAPAPVDEALKRLRRGDLIFWKGHVGVMRDAETLLHASGWHMKVVSEPLALARARIEETTDGAITSIRRL
jgi:cell wall-associated NlpC family hydrolase